VSLIAAMSADDAAILVVVVGARFLVPLLIPRFPLPAILACLVIDAADQSIFQQFTDLNLDGYQSYDKALDIYYLTIAYLSVIRNWPADGALKVAMFLWYYRLVGVMAFELSGARWLLMVFPNTFEYWFIAIEAVRTRYRPDRVSQRGLILTAAAIWIFIKLPQEWWIHVAQLDFTDFMKEDVFGVSVDTSWLDAIGENLWFVALIAVVVLALAIAWWKLRDRVPTPDWPLTFSSATVSRNIGWTPAPGAHVTLPWFGRELVEKIALVGLVSVIFYRVFPGAEARNVSVFLIAALTVVVNAGFGAWRSRAGRDRRSVGAQWFVTLLVNYGAMWLFAGLFAGDLGSVTLRDVTVFAVIIAMIVVLYDEYSHHRAACRLHPAGAPPESVQAGR
jgi:hypothetical protein